jgi:hypothetical protein
MIYSTDLDTGEGCLKLTAAENKAFKRGETVSKQSAKNDGVYCITVSARKVRDLRPSEGAKGD